MFATLNLVLALHHGRIVDHASRPPPLILNQVAKLPKAKIPKSFDWRKVNGTVSLVTADVNQHIPTCASSQRAPVPSRLV